MLKVLKCAFLLVIEMQIYFLWYKFSIGPTRFQMVKFLTNISHFIFRHHLEIPTKINKANVNQLPNQLTITLSKYYY